MKRIILLALMLVALFSAAHSQVPAPAEPTVTGWVLGSGFVTDHFDDWAGGFKIGTGIAVDERRTIVLRTCYSRFNFGPGEVASVEVTALVNWYIGKLWRVYAITGGEAYIEGNSGNDLVLGGGASRRIFTAKEYVAVPFSADLFGEILFADASGQHSGNYAQINIGLKIGKPE